MGITMKEIAYMCGVSRGTVDRVLNNRGHVHPKTEERIRAVAKTMGYRSGAPTEIKGKAASLTKIGVVVNALDHPYFAEILSGIISSLEALGDYNITGIIKLSGGFDVDQQLHFLDELLQQGVNALAITPANNPRIARKLEHFSKLGIPVVTVSSLLEDYEPFALVSSNHYMSGRIAADFAKLLLPPSAKIAVVTGSKSMPGLMLRLKGFVDVIHETRPDCTILDPIQSFDDDVIAYKSLSGLLSRHADIDLLFLAAGGYNGCFQALHDAVLPRRIRIISFDTNEINLTKLKAGVVSALFSQHPTQQGELAIRILSDYLLRRTVPEKRNFYIPVEILIAESVNTAYSNG